MIEMQTCRKDANTSDPAFGFSINKRTDTLNALINFLQYEIGYGGKIINVEENFDKKIIITTETKLFSKIDTVAFSGSKDEMDPLLRVTAAILYIQNDFGTELIDTTIKALGKYAGLPFWAVHAGPLCFGSASAKIALLSLLVDDSNSEVYKKLLQKNLEELCIAWGLNDYKSDGIETLL